MPREIRKRKPDSREDELFEISKEMLERQVWQGDGNEDFYDEEDEEGYEDYDGEDEDGEEYDDEEDDDEEDDGI